LDAVDAQMLAITHEYVRNCECLRIIGSNDGSPISAFRLGGRADPVYRGGSCVYPGSWVLLQYRGDTVVVIGMRVGDQNGSKGLFQCGDSIGDRPRLGKHELGVDQNEATLAFNDERINKERIGWGCVDVNFRRCGRHEFPCLIKVNLA
jgi:hypothetical protein